VETRIEKGMVEEKKYRNRVGIATKFILPTSALIILTSIVIASFLMIIETGNSRRDLLNHGRSVAALVAESSEHGIHREDCNILARLVESLEIYPDVVYVNILGKEGRPLAGSLKDPLLHTPAVPAESLPGDPGRIRHREFFDERVGGRYLDLLKPVVKGAGSGETGDEPRVIGYVQLGMTQERIHQRRAQVLYPTVVFTSLFVGLGILLNIILARKITSPIRKLSLATQEISEGKFQQHVVTDTGDEVSELARSFNRMLEHLRDYRKQVDANAAELSATNRKMLKEIDERKRTEEDLKSTKSRLQHLLTSSPAVIYSCRPSDDYRVTFVSENVSDLLGYQPDHFLKDPGFRFDQVHREDVTSFQVELATMSSNPTKVHEYRFKKSDGSYVWIRDELTLLLDEKGRPAEIIGCWVDITERRALEEQLISNALHDSLTKLPNRALFLDRLQLAFSRARRREGYLFAVLFLDIDRFKNVNDSLGHLVGDQLLVSVAERLKGDLHSDDTVARLGGDEFAILLDDIESQGNAKIVANRLREKLSLSFMLSDHEVFITASIGIAFMEHKDQRPAQLLRNADTAMYHAKALGRDCFTVFDESMHAQAVAFLQMENDLRRAVEKGEFHLNYQPIVELDTGRISGFEALLRWRHPDRGDIPPGEFIPVAEETGLIAPIGRWVLGEACRKMSVWHKMYPKEPPLTISVNLSIREFTANLPEEVGNILLETGLRADCLRLEITESALMRDASRAMAILEELKVLEVRLQLDDFGTGYSSLSYLHQLPIDALKIDRSFVSKIGIEDEDSEIVGAILSMAQSLNIDVVAEGIEEKEQLDYLRRLKCRYAQGFLFSRPLDEKGAGTLIQGSLEAVLVPFKRS
jgi:diguanylate cyclase (GGDEF)-like protein/PAS domain S-box-containing protein